MKKYLIIIVSATIISSLAYGQTATDALRFSQTFTGGTARFMSMGGAFGALGADFSTLSTNPGGLGAYKSSEFVFTPSIHVGSSNSTYNGGQGSDSRTNFAMGNAGYVYTAKVSGSGKASGFRYIQFAAGVNRINDYNRRFNMQGENTQNSLLDTYVEYANGTNYMDIEENRGGQYGFDLTPAWWTYLLDIGDTNNFNSYYSPIPHGGTLQRKAIDQWGSMNEWNFAFGANYEEILYIGMSLNIPWIRYFERSLYTETDVADTIYDFDQFNLNSRLETRGTGFNMKFGFILRPADFIRIGGAIQTPSWYTMKDYWDTYVYSYFDNGDNYSHPSPYGTYKYNLTTPMKVQGSLAFLFGQYGLISGEYEYINYAKAQFSSYDYPDEYYNVNNTISSSYTAGHNFKVGTEWRTGPFSFRAGYRYYNSPYQDGINDGALNSYSGGLGYKDKFYYIDFGYVFTKSVEDYYFYGTEDISLEPVVNELIDHRFMLTFGTRF